MKNRKINRLRIFQWGILPILFTVSIIACQTDKNTQTGHKTHAQNFNDSIKIMSFNVLYKTSIESTIISVKESGADIIGLQEASDKRIRKCADSLGMYYVAFDKTKSNLSGNDTGVLSKYPIVDTLKNGVIIELPGNIQLAVFSVHLSAYPYEPYDIRDGKIKAEDAEEIAANLRIPELSETLDEIKSLPTSITAVLTGDFNEASHLDWTQRAADSGMHFSAVINWPCSAAVIKTGLCDSFRKHFPNEVSHNGITWTPWKSENEVYDRIDFVYFEEDKILELTNSERVGGADHEGDIKIKGYESDHYAVLSTFKVN